MAKRQKRGYERPRPGIEGGTATHTTNSHSLPDNPNKNFHEVRGQEDDDEAHGDADDAGQLHAAEGDVCVKEQVRH